MAPMHPHSNSPATRSILVVEDTRQMTTLIRKQLQQLGYIDIDLAFDGPTALEKLGEKHYDVVLSDMRMEPMSGIELACLMRKEARWASLPVLMITGTGAAEDVVAAKEAGVAGYILKPFTLKTLKSSLERVLSNQL
jgi:two-component system, chemotaxis family, chemotaxis protein CheY